jgi:hypothetical protein
MPQAEDDEDQARVNPQPYVPPPQPPARPEAKVPVTPPPPSTAPAPAAEDKEPSAPPATTAQVTPPPPPVAPPASTPAAPAPQFSSGPPPTAAPPPPATTPPPRAVTVSPAPAEPPPAAASAAGSPAAKAIASITFAEARRVKNEPGYITVTIQGVTKGDGWTNITLRPQDATPTGPTRTFGVVATPPAQSQSQTEQPVKISVKMAMPADVKMIVLQSETNHQDANILP